MLHERSDLLVIRSYTLIHVHTGSPMTQVVRAHTLGSRHSRTSEYRETRDRYEDGLVSTYTLLYSNESNVGV